MLKFSIIIPAYNAEKTIEECIESVKKQTYCNWEVIVIDDGSNDKTADIAKKMLPQDKVITKENAGVSSARNLGIILAEGDYLLFLDADDYLPKDTLELYERTIRKEFNPDVVMGSFYKIYPQRKELCNPVGDKKKNIYDFKKEEFDPFFSRLIGTVWGKCYKTNLIKNARFDETLSVCEDAEFNFKELKKAEKIIYISQPVYNYVYSLNSTIRKYNTVNLKRYIKAVNKMIEENKTSFIKNNVLEFVCTVFNVVCFNLVFTSQNSQSYWKKKNIIKKLRHETSFKIAIENVVPDMLTLKHRIAIFFVKRDMYFGIYVMSVANQILNKLTY